jgi:hypothetical protein
MVRGMPQFGVVQRHHLHKNMIVVRCATRGSIGSGKAKWRNIRPVFWVVSEAEGVRLPSGVQTELGHELGHLRFLRLVAR